MAKFAALFAAAVIAVAALCPVPAKGGNVTYDRRSLIIDGKHRLLFSGSIHYTRSTPDMWPLLIGKAKRGGLDVIQTYVFWNVHEPVQGQFNFEGPYDLVRFIKEVVAQSLYVNLRVGPFIESEWKFGGFPLWLREVPGISFRSDNEPFKRHMRGFVSMIVKKMKSERLYASQGGPIIMSQIENEYSMVEGAYHEKGPSYVRWAASMAVDLHTGVPWTMCKQDDAPDPLINTCNGLKCGETFKGPNNSNKPAIWTENWTSQYQVFGGEPYKRRPEEIAFQVAYFIAKDAGSFVNYYMYHGGTNLRNSASAFVTTSYYDEAPLDEYGLIRQPIFDHLRHLHRVIKRASLPLIWGQRSNFSIGASLQQEGYMFKEDESKGGWCVAFLVNHDTRDTEVQFENITYNLPGSSISILSDCKNEVYNTAKVSAQYSHRSADVVQSFNEENRWDVFVDVVPDIHTSEFTSKALENQISVAKDSTDYLWYTTEYENTVTRPSCTRDDDDQFVLQVYSLAHVLHVFVNGAFVGNKHGSHDERGGLDLEIPITLKKGSNSISLLSGMVGLPDSGAYLERRFAGLRRVKISSPATNYTRDISNNLWGYQVGLLGEKKQIFSEHGTKSVDWRRSSTTAHPPLIWYKTYMDSPAGSDPVALNMTGMGKGQVWINGENIGRYWVSFKSPSTNTSSQILYHVPRSFLKPSRNLLVVLEEEEGGDPFGITLDTVSITGVCSSATNEPPASRAPPANVGARLRCPPGKVIAAIDFASYGNPAGGCDERSFTQGSCHSNLSTSVAEEACLGRRGCSISLSSRRFGEEDEACLGIRKSLIVAASCR